jgi:hypothetical protein
MVRHFRIFGFLLFFSLFGLDAAFGVRVDVQWRSLVRISEVTTEAGTGNLRIRFSDGQEISLVRPRQDFDIRAGMSAFLQNLPNGEAVLFFQLPLTLGVTRSVVNLAVGREGPNDDSIAGIIGLARTDREVLESGPRSYRVSESIGLFSWFPTNAQYSLIPGDAGSLSLISLRPGEQRLTLWGFLRPAGTLNYQSLGSTSGMDLPIAAGEQRRNWHQAPPQVQYEEGSRGIWVRADPSLPMMEYTQALGTHHESQLALSQGRLQPLEFEIGLERVSRYLRPTRNPNSPLGPALAQAIRSEFRRPVEAIPTSSRRHEIVEFSIPQALLTEESALVPAFWQGVIDGLPRSPELESGEIVLLYLRLPPNESQTRNQFDFINNFMIRRNPRQVIILVDAREGPSRLLAADGFIVRTLANLNNSELRFICLTRQGHGLEGDAAETSVPIKPRQLPPLITEAARAEALHRALQRSGIQRTPVFVSSVLEHIRTRQTRSGQTSLDVSANYAQTLSCLEQALLRLPSSASADEVARQVLQEAGSELRFAPEVVSRAAGISRELGAHGSGRYSPLVGMDEHLEILTDRTLTFLSYPARSRPFLVTVLMGPPGTGKNRVAEDTARILNGNISQPYSIINFRALRDREALLPTRITELVNQINALRRSPASVRTLVLDEVHADPELLTALLPALGDSDRAAALGLDLTGLDIKLLMNIDRDSAAYQEILRLSPRDLAYSRAARRLFVDSIYSASRVEERAGRATLEALASRLADSFFVFRPPQPQEERQGREFVARILGSFEERHHMRLVATDDARGLFSQILSAEADAGFRGAQARSNQEVERAFARFLREHPDHQFSGIYQLTLDTDGASNGGAPRLELRALEEQGPVLETQDTYTRLRHGLESALLSQIDHRTSELRQTVTPSRRGQVEEELRHLRQMLRGFQSAGSTPLFDPESLHVLRPRAEVVQPLGQIAYPQGLHREERRLLQAAMRDPIEEQFQRIHQSLGPENSNHHHQELSRALESVLSAMILIRESEGTSDSEFRQWLDRIIALATPREPTHTGRGGAPLPSQRSLLASEETGLASGVVADTLLRLIARDHYVREHQRYPEVLAARLARAGSGSPVTGTGVEGGGTLAANCQTLRQRLAALRRPR